MSYCKYEQETSIVWDEEQKKACIYSASPVTLLKLNRLCEQFPGEYKCVWKEMNGDRMTAAKYEAPARYIRFAKPASPAKVEAGKRTAAKMKSAPSTATYS